MYLLQLDLSVFDEEDGVSVLLGLLDIVVGCHAGLCQFHAGHSHLEVVCVQRCLGSNYSTLWFPFKVLSSEIK